MASVVYLKKGERLPRRRHILIEEIANRSQESAAGGPNGTTLRISQMAFDRQLEGLLTKFAGSDLTIYVGKLAP